METTTRTINGREYRVLAAEDGRVICRIHDGFNMGKEVVLGTDFSAGDPREDLPEHYEETDDPSPATDREKDEALNTLGIEL